ncbi:HET-domain-containing protein [Phaeosphaeriaceae sp. SRC1lsM3a]|nr:HET-domain-containing protein [Stagonospora sp. SRC1lsM3a]
MRSEQIRCQRTFMLKETSFTDPHFRTPVSHNTESDEVYHLVRYWMSKCTCIQEPPTPDTDAYPKRLISLEKLKKKDHFDSETLQSSIDLRNPVVKLVETADWNNDRPTQEDGKNNPFYVTLSHCWGTVPSPIHWASRLTSDNIKKRKDGMRFEELPKTFQQAMRFAARLTDVGYIWIDTLCIKQGDEADWLEQSAKMDGIYKNAFLNISATAASNSGEGIFQPRRPELLLEDEVLLNIDGLPGATTPSRTNTSRSNISSRSGDIETNAGGERPSTAKKRKHVDNSTSDARKDSFTGHASRVDVEMKRSDLRRCTVLDVSFWTDRVDQAPVNTRGWVLQERLMAGRVLHFCQDQVAWECCEFEAAEGLPANTPNFQVTVDGIREGSRLKALRNLAEGKRLRRLRFRDTGDPDPHLRPEIYSLELWRRIVEVYSKTAVTNDKDKLIALSGMARWMSRRVAKSDIPARLQYANPYQANENAVVKTTQYIAGLWAWNLASQLLWYVEPKFQAIDDSFHHPTTAPTSYRAPSFSWASINADKGNGIRYAEVTDQDLLITIDQASVEPKSGSDEFGLLESAEVVILGQLRRANFSLSEKAKGRFEWRLMDRDELSEEEHTIVFLDCPERDVPGILGPDAEVYIVPAALGDRTASKDSKYLTCLILQLDHSRKERPSFRRVGVTKLSPYGDHKALEGLEILKKYESDGAMPHRGDDPKTGKKGYDDKTGMHRIFLI